MVSQEVQALLDQVKQERGLVASVDLGMKALRVQVDDLSNKLNAVPAAPAPAMSPDDKAALVSMTNDLAASVTTLQGDIPANVAAASAPAGAPDLTQPPTTPPPATEPDPAVQAADSAAAAAATPMAGTGTPATPAT